MTLKKAQNYNVIDDVDCQPRADNLMKQTVKARQC